MTGVWEVVLVVSLFLGCGVGVALTAVRLPGTWLIVVMAFGFVWWKGWERAGLIMAAVLVGIALVGEGVELLASVFTARKAGATRQAAWGGLIGGFAGMLFLSFLVPVPLVGTMVGAMVGCFAGATIAELHARKKLADGARVGLFSALGFVLGTATKVALALVMSGILLTSAVCSRSPSEERPGGISLSGRPAQFIKDDSRPTGARHGPPVGHFQSLDDLASAQQVRSGKALLFVDESFDDPVSHNLPVLAHGFKCKDHRAGFVVPFPFGLCRSGRGHVVEPVSVVPFFGVVPAQCSDRTEPV